MTTLDHLRAVLATLNDKAHAAEEVQRTIADARRHIADLEDALRAYAATYQGARR